jgi:hypothetical protein
MLAHPELTIPGKLNVKAGVAMLVAAIVLGWILSQVQPLPLAPRRLRGSLPSPSSGRRCPNKSTPGTFATPFWATWG